MSLPVPASQRYRTRALECRAMADRFRLDFARTQVLKAAGDFDRIADETREREINMGITHVGRLVRGLHSPR